MPRRGRDAVRGRRRRRRPRRAAGRRAGDDLHGLAGPAADDPQHVQDRRRADAVLHARRGAHARDARALDLRRPLRRHGLPPDRLRAALLGLGAGGARPRRDRARGDAARRASRSCTSSTASAPRTRSRKIELLERRRPARHDRRRARRGAPRSARSRPTARCCAARRRTPTSSSRRARPCNRFYDACPAIVQEAMDRFAERTGRRYRLFDYVGAPRGRARDRADGLGRRDGARDRRAGCVARGERVGVLKVRLYRPFSVDATSSRRCRRRVRAHRGARPHQGAGRGRRAALPRRRRGAARGRRASAPAASPRVDRRPLRALVARSSRPAMVKAVFDELAPSRAAQPLHGRHRRRRHAHSRCRATRSSTSSPTTRVRARLLRPRRRRHRRAPTRTRSRSSARRPTTTRRATSSTTRRSRARSRSRTCASARGRSAPPT